MSIGLMDMDFMTYVHVPFNLEIMKLAAYFKSKKEVTILVPKLEPERYSSFYLRKDFNDGNFPSGAQLSKISYGGYAFSNNIYTPLPIDIEKTYPDKQLYTKYRDLFSTNQAKQLIFNTLQNMEHIRISLDNFTISKDIDSSINISKNTNILMFHDYNLNQIKDSHLYVRELLNYITNQRQHTQLLCTKFPIQVDNEADLLKWSEFNPSLYFGIKYNGFINDSCFFNLFSDKNKKSFCEKIIYNFTTNCDSEQEVIQNILPRIYRQALFAKSLGIKISLTYTDNFFINKKWENLIALMNLYFSQNKYKQIFKPGYRDFSKTFTLYRYITSPSFHKYHNMFSVEELRELFVLVRLENYELFKMFYEVAQVEYKGGIFQ